MRRRGADVARESQWSFAGGEITPKLLGRVDTDRYRTSARLIRNFIVRPQGGAELRPGTRLVREVKDSANAVRLIPFVFSSAQSYVLEFGPAYVRFHTAGQTVLDPGTGLPLEVPTPYAASDLRALQYFQSGDILTLVHPLYQERELRRTGATSWQLTQVTNAPTQLPPTSANLAQGNTGAADSLEWEWVVTAVSDTGEESIASNVVSANVKLDVVNRVDKAKIAWTAPTGAAPAYYNVYRGRNGQHGFIGQAKGRTFFFDDNFAPVYSESPPSGADPFASGNYPGAGTYYEQRKFLAASNANPLTVYGSESSIFNSFRRSSPPRESDAIQFPVKQPRVDRVSWMLGLESGLIIGTPSRIVRVRGDEQTRILTAISVDQKGIESRGAATLQPLEVGNTYLYLTFDGLKPREGAFEDWDVYRSTDLSVMAEHLFRTASIVAWAYADQPYALVSAVRSDGVLLGLTYLPEHQVWAWHQHTTTGLYEDVVAVPEGASTRVYVVVRRTVAGQTRRYLERVGLTEQNDSDDDLHLDSALSYDGRVTDGSTAQLAGTVWTTGSTVSILTSTPRFGAGDVGSQVVFPYETATERRELRCTITAVAAPTNVQAVLEANAPAALQNATVTNWSLAARTFRGLSHLEGLTVRACADGKSVGEMVVVEGAVTLPQPASVVHVGLPYVGRLESLEISDFGARKQVQGVTVTLQNTRSVFVGERVANQLDEVAPRAFEGLFEKTQGILGAVHQKITTSTNRGAGVVIEAREPIACRVLGWIAETDSGRA